MNQSLNQNKKWEWNWDSLSLYRSELMGVAILMIMFFHIEKFHAVSNHPLISQSILYQFIQNGNSGVDVFVFLSGMGIYFAWSKRPELLSFYRKRVLRILPTYLVISGLYWLILMLKRYLYLDLGSFIKLWIANVSCYTWLTENCRVFWYIPFQIVLYLVSPLILTLFSKNKWIRYGSFIFMCFLCYFSLYLLRGTSYYEIFEIAISRIPAFLCGCFIGQKVARHDNMSKWWALLIPAAFFGKPVRKLLAARWPAFNIFIRVPVFLIGLAFCLFSCFALSEICSDKLNRCLQWLGSRSLELYLLHIAYRNLAMVYIHDLLNSSTKMALLIYAIVLILSCVTAELISSMKRIKKR